MYDEFKSSIRQRIFWWISGADMEVLEECPAKEQNKYSAIGATILITSVIASLSGGYAAFVMTKSYVVSVIFGAFWGGSIMTIDRLMISTMRKTPENNKFSELLSASIRIVLALLIAFVVSKPAEVKLLENQIDRFISYSKSKEQNEILKGYAKNLEIDKINKDIEDIERQKASLKEEKENITSENAYVTLSEQEEECTRQFAALTKQIRNLEYERVQIRKFKYPKFNQKNKAYVVNGQVTQSLPPVGVAYTETTVDAINPEGLARIDYINSQVLSKRRTRAALGCNQIAKAMESYYKSRTNDIKTDESRLRMLERRKDSLLAIREYKLDSINSRNGEILDRANNDFFGKVLALEEGKRQNIFFGSATDVENISKDSVTSYISEEDKLIFQDVVDLQYTVQLNSVNYQADTINSNIPKSSSTTTVRYYRDPNLVKKEINLMPSLGLADKNILWWSSTILFLFFITIELLPIISKIISDYGIYDQLIEEKDRNTFDTMKKII